MIYSIDLNDKPKGYRIHIYKDKKNMWRWRFLAPNDRVIADSGEGYTLLSNCKAAVKRLFYIIDNKNIFCYHDK
jgi:uncharacterized protein YegP (UPF0339 family)